jgi:hypothetical protein
MFTDLSDAVRLLAIDNRDVDEDVGIARIGKRHRAAP